MKMEYYEEFVKLAETGSFSKTAESFSFTQAALTQHIQQMESLYGVKLFDRSTRRVELSDFGKLVLPHAKRMVKLKGEALSAVEQQLMHKHYHLSIGFYPAAARYNFVDRMQAFSALNPDISIRFRELLPEALIESMEMGEFDFVILEEEDSRAEKNYDRLCLNKDSLAAVLPISHPLSDYSEVLLTQLAKEQFLMMPEHTFVHQMATNACKSKGFSPAVTYTSYSISNLLEIVEKGRGISLLMKTPAMRYKNQGVSVLDLIPKIYSSVNLLYRESELSDYGRRFLDFMMTQAENE